MIDHALVVPTQTRLRSDVRLRTLSVRPRITRRGVQLALGLIWLVDAALQFQPKMFTGDFAHQVIQPAGTGQPGIVSWPIKIASHLILWQPAVINAGFALIQLVIALALLSPLIVTARNYGRWLLGRERLALRTDFIIKVGLGLSVVWAAGVWYLGEGAGGMTGGHAMLLTGAPGAALIYAVLAVAVWPRSEGASPPPASWLRWFWALLWIGGAGFQLLVGQNTVGDLRNVVSTNAQAAPGWLHSLDTSALSVIPRGGATGVILLVVIQLVIGLGALLARRGRFGDGLAIAAVSSGIGLSLAFWFIGQSLGAYWTGTATDPNAAPLFILLGAAVLAVGKGREAEVAPVVVELW